MYSKNIETSNLSKAAKTNASNTFVNHQIIDSGIMGSSESNVGLLLYAQHPENPYCVPAIGFKNSSGSFCSIVFGNDSKLRVSISGKNYVIAGE